MDSGGEGNYSRIYLEVKGRERKRVLQTEEESGKRGGSGQSLQKEEEKEKVFLRLQSFDTSAALFPVRASNSWHFRGHSAALESLVIHLASTSPVTRLAVAMNNTPSL